MNIPPRAPLFALLLALGMSGAPARAAEPAATQPATVTQEDALAAWHRFKAAPLDRLEDAPVFLKYMQGGATHTVLNGKLVFFMYEDYPPETRAVLYAAYMGGNLESQLVTRRQGDDPQAAMSAVLDAYAALKTRDSKLAIAKLDELAAARAAGRFPAAVDALAGGRP